MSFIRHTLGLLLLSFAASLPAQVTAVPQLDLNRFMGSWYEIAQLPTKRDKPCASDSLVMFTNGEKKDRFDVVKSCSTKDDTADARDLNGKAPRNSADGRLKIGPFWPFYSRFWVLAIGADYDWALIGSPDHKTLWILSRKTTLPDDILSMAKSKAAAEGFDLSRLMTVIHNR